MDFNFPEVDYLENEISCSDVRNETLETINNFSDPNNSINSISSDTNTDYQELEEDNFKSSKTR